MRIYDLFPLYSAAIVVDMSFAVTIFVLVGLTLTTSIMSITKQWCKAPTPKRHCPVRCKLSKFTFGPFFTILLYTRYSILKWSKVNFRISMGPFVAFTMRTRFNMLYKGP